MRGHFINRRLINWRFVGPLLACVAAALSIAAVAIGIYRHSDYSVLHTPAVAPISSSDALRRALAHCQEIGAAAQTDRNCFEAWAESRRRFFDGGRTP